jgi:hypothetical protein
MDASFLRDMMHDAFLDKSRLAYNYLLEPFSLRVGISYKKSFEAAKDPYRYMINTLIT